jgi:hypothetical protein
MRNHNMCSLLLMLVVVVVHPQSFVSSGTATGQMIKLC